MAKKKNEFWVRKVGGNRLVRTATTKDRVYHFGKNVAQTSGDPHGTRYLVRVKGSKAGGKDQAQQLTVDKILETVVPKR